MVEIAAIFNFWPYFHCTRSETAYICELNCGQTSYTVVQFATPLLQIERYDIHCDLFSCVFGQCFVVQVLKWQYMYLRFEF